MVVNPDLDGCNKTLNDRKIRRKNVENNTLRKTKRILKPKYKPNGAQLLSLACLWF